MQLIVLIGLSPPMVHSYNKQTCINHGCIFIATMQQDLIFPISQYLDHGSLARLLATSKENMSLLSSCFTVKARPHLLKYMSGKIIDARFQANSSVYSMHTKEDDGCTIRFTSTNRFEYGPMALFAVRIMASDSICITVRVGYSLSHCKEHNNTPSSFSLITGITTVHFTPSKDHPLISGDIQINNSEIIAGCGFDPLLILKWCPVEMPPTTTPVFLCS
jgi:hypothetical protein